MCCDFCCVRKMSGENKSKVVEPQQTKLLFQPTTPLELGLKLLAPIDIRECTEDLNDLRQFVLDFCFKANVAVNRMVEQCGMKSQYDTWMPSLCNAYDINGLLRCLCFESSVVHVYTVKRQLRSMLVDAWATLNFKGVNESYFKWEACSTLRQRATIRAGIVDATLDARRMGLSDEDIVTSIKKFMDEAEEPQATASK